MSKIREKPHSEWYNRSDALDVVDLLRAKGLEANWYYDIDNERYMVYTVEKERPTDA